MTKHSRFALDFKGWPQTDQAAWTTATNDTHIFSKGGLASNWSPKTQRQTEKGYGLWLGFLARHDRLCPVSSPGERLTEINLALFRDELEERVASCTVASRVRDLKEAIRVMEPSANLTLVRKLLSVVTHKAQPSRDKRSRMVPPRQLLDAGIERMRRTETDKFVKADSMACHYRDGLMIAVLATRSIMRLGCFTAMRMGQHIVRKNGVYVCHFDGIETKNGDDLDFELPAALTSYIDNYLQKHRKTLLRGYESDAFWISTYRGAISEQTTRLRVREAVLEEVGVRLPPHMFRDCTATAVAVDDPGHVRIVPRLLHHRDERTAERFYNQADGISASRQMNAVLLELRHRALTKNPRGPRYSNRGG